MVHCDAFSYCFGSISYQFLAIFFYYGELRLFGEKKNSPFLQPVCYTEKSTIETWDDLGLYLATQRRF